MRGKEPAAMLPKPWPDAFAICQRDMQVSQGGARKEAKPAFTHRRRQGGEFHLQLEQEHEPVGLALKAMLADQSGEPEIRRQKFQSQFLVGLAGGAGIGGFALVGMQLAPARTPEPAIWLLRPFQQQHFVARVEAVKQRGDLVGQFHRRSEAIGRQVFNPG